MMNNKYALDEWLIEADTPAMGGQPDMSAGQAPASDPYAGAPPGTAGAPGPDPNVTNQPGQDGQEDITNDPEKPDMPEQKEEEDFETWKKKFLKASVKGDSNELIDILNEKRDAQGLRRIQKKFVEDNMQIQIMRQSTNVDKASKDIRKLLKDQLDKNNPATSVVTHMYSVLQTVPMLNNIFIKMEGYGAQKGDLHRKFVASLLGAVQVSVGANEEDIIFNEREYSIGISTRFASVWGSINLGDWALKEDDPERFLAAPERKRLKEGSPEEKDVLRRRLVLESMAEQFKERAFLVNVVAEDGTIYTLGWDIANALRQGYTDGRLLVRTRFSDNSEAAITDEGEIVPYVDLSVMYIKETGDQDEEGHPETEEVEFLQKRNGRLYLVAGLQIIRDAATALSGTSLQETPYQGNPSDLATLQRCVYSCHELLIGRTC